MREVLFLAFFMVPTRPEVCSGGVNVASLEEGARLMAHQAIWEVASLRQRPLGNNDVTVSTVFVEQIGEPSTAPEVITSPRGSKQVCSVWSYSHGAVPGPPATQKCSSPAQLAGRHSNWDARVQVQVSCASKRALLVLTGVIDWKTYPGEPAGTAASTTLRTSWVLVDLKGDAPAVIGGRLHNWSSAAFISAAGWSGTVLTD